MLFLHGDSSEYDTWRKRVFVRHKDSTQGASGRNGETLHIADSVGHSCRDDVDNKVTPWLEAYQLLPEELGQW